MAYLIPVEKFMVRCSQCPDWAGNFDNWAGTKAEAEDSMGAHNRSPRHIRNSASTGSPPTASPSPSQPRE